MRTIIVVGPGHGLNELTNRLLVAADCIVNPEQNTWELYPGPFGLYARHCDDAIFQGNKDMIDFYNDHVRQDIDCDGNPRNNGNIGKFIRMYEKQYVMNQYPDSPKTLVIYINTIDIESIVKYVSTYTSDTTKYEDLVECVCTDIDLSEPAMREHHLLMEFSTDAAQDVDYAKEIDLHVMCDQLFNKYCEMEEVRQLCNDLSVKMVSANDLLIRGDYSKLITLADRLDPDRIKKTIDIYNFVNTKSTNPLLSQIRNMRWDDIVELGKRT
jgi:hypothetical protein|tara:strand:- start:986 stop:1792 length:807 start_codon:yes stop_codon:yes gene_type:complete